MSERREQFSVEGPVRLEVELRSGAVLVAEGPAGEVAVHIDGTQPEQLVVARSGQTIVVRQEFRRSWFEDRGSYRVMISTPAGAELGATLASADLDVEVDLGGLRVETASGDIRAANISGDAEVKAASGEVWLGDVAGRVRASSASGAVRLGSTRGGANVNTASGDVTVGRADGPVAVKTASGSVDVGRLTGPELVVKTVSGDVEVGVLPGTELGFEANTMSGRVVLPEPAAEEHPVERSVRLAFRSVSGDLRVKRV